MKKCFKCGLEKDLSEYYKHPNMGDGHLGKCKDCTKKDSDKRERKLRNNPDWVEKEKSRAREKYHRLYTGGVHKPSSEKKIQAMRRYREKFPEKYAAKSYMGNRIKPLINGNQLHHWSYNKEHCIDVIELSVREHNKSHRYMIYDQERMMYRRIDNNELLDTKEKHQQWIMWCIENKED